MPLNNPKFCLCQISYFPSIVSNLVVLNCVLRGKDRLKINSILLNFKDNQATFVFGHSFSFKAHFGNNSPNFRWWKLFLRTTISLHFKWIPSWLRSSMLHYRPRQKARARHVDFLNSKRFYLSCYSIPNRNFRLFYFLLLILLAVIIMRAFQF